MEKKRNLFLVGIFLVVLLLNGVSAFCSVESYIVNSTGVMENGFGYIVCSGGGTADGTYSKTNVPVMVWPTLGGLMDDCQEACPNYYLNATTIASQEFGETSGTFVTGDGDIVQRNVTTQAPPRPAYYNNATTNDSYGSEEVSIFWNMSDGTTITSGNFSYNSSNDSTVYSGGTFGAVNGDKTFSGFISMAAGTIVYWWSSALGAGLTTISEVYQFIIQKLTNPISLIVPSGGWSQVYPASGDINCSDNTGGQITPTAFRDSTSIGLIEDVSGFSVGAYNITCNVSESQNYTAESESSILNISKNPDPLNLSGIWTMDYGSANTINCINNTGGQSIVKLYRNDTGELGELADDASLLSAGNYNYTCNTTESQNYTAESESQILVINKIIPNVTAANNVSDSANYNEIVNISCSGTGGFNFTIKNSTDSILVSGQLPLSAGYQMQATETFNCSTDGNENYTAASDTTTVSVTPPIYPNYSIGSSTTTYNAISVNVIWNNFDNRYMFYNWTGHPTVENSTSFSGDTFNFLVNQIAAGDTIYWRQNASNVSIGIVNDSMPWQSLVVTQDSSPCDVLFNETSPVNYGTSFLAYTNCSSAFVLYRNATSISNASVQSLAAGSYNFSVARNDTQNYSNVYDEEIFVVSKIDPGLVIASNATWSVADEVSVNISCSMTATQTIPITLTAPDSGVVASGNNSASYVFISSDGTDEGLWSCASTAVENYSADSASNTLAIATGFSIISVECSNDSQSNWYNCSTISYGDTITHIRAEINGINDSTDFKFNLRNIDDSQNYINNQSNTSVSGNYAVYASNYLLRDSGDWELNVTAFGVDPVTSVNSQTWSYPYGNVQVDWISPTASGNIDWLEFTNINVNISCISGECGALNATLYSGNQTSTTSGATPFYTTDSNPQTISALYGESSQSVDWDVNATGSVGSSYDFFVNANMTSNINNVSDNSSTILSMNIYFNDTTDPVIVSMVATPSTVKVNETVTINVTVSDDIGIDSIWVNLTYPGGTNVLFDLPKTFTDTINIGKYNVTYYVNDTSGNVASDSRWFEVGEELNATINVSIDIASGLNESTEIIFQLVHPDFGDVIYQTVANGSFNVSIPDVKYDFVFLGAFDGTMNITLKKVNISENEGNSIKLDKHKEITGYLVTYGISTNYIFNISEVLFGYADEIYTNEDNLRLMKCSGSDYNFTGRICSVVWADITSSATKNTTNDYFKLDTYNFSGFGIKEYVAPTGGGGGGCTVRDWTCEDWSECINGIQTRSCISNCRTSKTEEQDCEVEEIPEQLFDITFTLDDYLIQSPDELTAIVTFESFGVEPTPVNLTFTILDEFGTVYAVDSEFIVVITEEVLRKKFEALHLPEGKYIIVLETLYNIDVMDKFRQEFEIGEERGISLWIWIVGGGIVVGGLIIWLIYWLIKRKKKKTYKPRIEEPASFKGKVSHILRKGRIRHKKLKGGKK